MVTLRPQYILDTAGQKLVVATVSEYNSILEALEELEDIRLYNKAKKADTGERIPMDEVFRRIEEQRKSAS